MSSVPLQPRRGTIEVVIPQKEEPVQIATGGLRVGLHRRGLPIPVEIVTDVNPEQARESAATWLRRRDKGHPAYLIVTSETGHRLKTVVIRPGQDVVIK